jgi:hypothetical protein
MPPGTIQTQLLALKILSQPLADVWQTVRGVLEDERLRTKLLAPLDPAIPDAIVSMNRAEVPDPLTPAVEEVIRKERAEKAPVMHRLLYALRMRKALLPVILRETWGAGFQRDEARVAARLGFPLQFVRLAVAGKKLVRQ